MKRLLFSLLLGCAAPAMAQTDTQDTILPVDYLVTPLVDFEAYLALANEVYAYRQGRVIGLQQFNAMASRGAVILDTRSKEMYDAKHIKGAIHLNFSDFTYDNLRALIPDENTMILIYCNNNFMLNIGLEIQDRYFMSKGMPPKPVLDAQEKRNDQLTLALNIPTFINLYGYGYKNIFELGELVQSENNPNIQFEGTAVNATSSTGARQQAPR